MTEEAKKSLNELGNESSQVMPQEIVKKDERHDASLLFFFLILVVLFCNN